MASHQGKLYGVGYWAQPNSAVASHLSDWYGGRLLAQVNHYQHLGPVQVAGNDLDSIHPQTFSGLVVAAPSPVPSESSLYLGSWHGRGRDLFEEALVSQSTSASPPPLCFIKTKGCNNNMAMVA